MNYMEKFFERFTTTDWAVRRECYRRTSMAGQESEVCFELQPDSGSPSHPPLPDSASGKWHLGKDAAIEAPESASDGSGWHYISVDFRQWNGSNVKVMPIPFTVSSVELSL